jgi:pimeloyl-ACP methyl ester carboxylesterase
VRDLEPPIREGAAEIAPGRTLGFAEFGDPQGRPLLWFHGTPGGRRQLPPDAPGEARARRLRIIGVERPGTGRSTPARYRCVRDAAGDIARLADVLALDRFGVIGLSGGGPYALACAHDLPDRVVVAVVLGGVAPLCGPGAVHPWRWSWLRLLAPAMDLARDPVALALQAAVRALLPVGYQAIDLYARLAPRADRPVLRDPLFRTMFVEDLSNAAREGLRAPVHDVALFARPWGFSLGDIRVPVRFWQGEADGIVPPNHCAHQASLIPDARLVLTPGEGHFAGFQNVRTVLDAVDACWSTPADRRPARAGAPAGG